jgi:hypothetical protein
MQKRLNKFIVERIKRVKFIKAELARLIENSIEQNKYINYKTQLGIYFARSSINSKFSISNMKIYCPFIASSRKVHRKYRLSRFAFNKHANTTRIPGLMKRG